MRPGDAQPGALPGAGQHSPGRDRRPRLTGLPAAQLHQQHPVTAAAARVLGGDVVKIGVDHRRADPLDQTAANDPALNVPRVLRFRLGAVGVVRAVAHVQVRGAAHARTGRHRAGAGRPDAALAPLTDAPVASQDTTRRSRAERTAASKRSRAPSGSIFGCRRRAPAARAGWPAPTSRAWPRNTSSPIRACGQPAAVQRLAEFAVDAEGGLMQVEALQAHAAVIDNADGPYGRFPCRHGSPSGSRTSAPSKPR